MHGNQGLSGETDMMYLKHDPLLLKTLFRERNLSLAALKVHKSAIAAIVDPLSTSNI